MNANWGKRQYGYLMAGVFLFCQVASFGANISSNAVTGSWNAVGSWLGGVVPVAGDNVTIVNGAIINVTTNVTGGLSPVNLTIQGNGILNFNTATITLTITGILTLNQTGSIQGNGTDRILNAGGSFAVLSTATNTIIQNIQLNVAGATQIDGSLTFNTANTATKSFASITISATGTWTNTSQNVPFSMSGDFINSGTFNQGTGRVSFTGATSNIIAGISTSAFGGGITVNKGVSQANLLDVQSLITMVNGGLIITNGTFKLTSGSTIVPFTADPGFGSTARLWCNGGTMNSTANINWTFSGTIQLSAGTINFGTAASNYLFANNGSAGLIQIDGGALNVTGRTRGGSNWNYIMSGGVITLGTIGNSAGFYPFTMDTAGSQFTMTGGTIVIQRPDATTPNGGYRNISSTGTFTGGTLQIGDGSTPAASTIGINTTVPIYNLTVNSANATAQVQTQAITVNNDVLIASGALAANNQNITVRGNWTNNGTFTPTAANTVTFNGTAASQTIGGTSSTSFTQLTFNNTFATIPSIILGINTTATTLITMTSGIVNMAGFTFTLGASGAASTLTRTGSTTTNWMYGGTFKRFWLTATTLTSNSANFYGLFPVGSSVASSYRPFEVNTAGNITTNGSFAVTLTNTSGFLNISPTGPEGIVRIINTSFVTAITGVTAGTFTVTATMTGLDPGTPSDIRLAIFTGGTTAGVVGTHVANSGTAPNPVVGRSAITIIANLNNDFRIATTNIAQTPLPIELLDFTARLVSQKVEINWSTASELNNDYFTIDKSSDAKEFAELIKVKGAGTKMQMSSYSAIDEKPYAGTSYYRLKQTDFGGVTKIHNIIAVSNNQSQEMSVLVYPNPSLSGDVKINMNGYQDQENVLITIFDVYGKKLYSNIQTVDSAGSLTAFIGRDILPQGLYVVSVYSKAGTTSHRIIIK